MTRILPLPLRRVGIHLARWHRTQIVDQVDHAEIVAEVSPDAYLSRRYLFMITVACGIAMLGLLQNSPAVIIGAMLISPLMGPIMGLGFSLCVLNLHSMRRTLVALAVGTALALAISALITHLSPLHEATPEILARTRPNLFDLLVAVFSGLAGAYTTIKRKGEAIVGVAIATALMPPLAVVGYGLAVGNFKIAGGAAFLFMTNLLAISLCTTMMARWYGFGARNRPAHTLFQSALVIVTFALISIPLAFALRQIAQESWLTQQVRSTLTGYFGQSLLRVDTLRVRQSGRGDVDINAVALVQRWSPTARPDLERALRAKLQRPFHLNIDQLVVGHDTPTTAQPVQALTMDTLQAVQQRLARDEAANGLRARLEHAATIPLRNVVVDATGTQAVLYGAGTPGMTLAAAAAAESRLRQQFPHIDITVIPATTALPSIGFALGKSAPDAAGVQALSLIRWALTRWQVSHVMVTGYASTPRERRGFDNLELARRRAASVGNGLRTAGFQVTERADFPVDHQPQLERDQGIVPFQAVRVTLDNDRATNPTP
ncbi:TIGR00341 family protein [Rhodanobacter glycinis]|uniref:TIGR00341 family protein n=1 Tax=Rhodanobacter glycinis TaxID=582702 RepID=A0A5B9E3L8_9GAMM|nr:TIGR00341 family protein [Rhodanobacter glycinis]QEE25150.1 TIGR00341 family protein [Rhodanobacter glycinis]